jgi:uncharacterized protein YndB with AHSA1/START domain
MKNAIASLVTLVLAGSLQVGAAAERSIDKSVVVPATLDQTWDAWTTREGITSFFAPDAKIEAKPGGAFHIYINPLAEPGLKGADDMRFMALQPKQMLSFDWNAPPHLSAARQQRTMVVLRFVPVSEKETRVSLHHSGWGDGGEWDKTYAYFDRAWDGVLGNLKKRFETGPQDWTEWMNSLRKMQEQAAQKK